MSQFRSVPTRLGVYAFCDKDGIVDRYVSYFLNDLCKHVDRLVIVCGAELTDDGLQALSSAASDVIVRPNGGFDAAAYREGLRFVGREALNAFDEVVFCSDAIMGPVFPLAETFREMDSRDVDFWGLTRRFEEHPDYWYPNGYGYIPDSVQTCFFAVRKPLLESDAFHDFFEALPELTSLSDADAHFETRLTKYFSDMGFHWETFVDESALDALISDPFSAMPRVMIEERRCPVFAHRPFWDAYGSSVDTALGDRAADLLDFLRTRTDYDVDMIFEYLLRTRHACDLVTNLNLVYLFGQKYSGEALPPHRVCLLMHLYFPDLIEDSFRRAQNIPEGTDVYITTDTEEKAAAIRRVFAKGDFGKLEVRVIPNRGRDVAALLVGLRDVISDYEICCFVHDKKTGQTRPGLIGQSFAEHCFGNTLASRDFCRGIISCFEENPRLGLLCPPTLNHSLWYTLPGNEWAGNFECAEELAARLHLSVPMAPDKPPVAPLGSMFWFRSAAMKPLFEYPWRYEDFPPEPLANNGALNHAIERIHPFVVQQSGFYPAYVMDHRMARARLTYQDYCQKQLDRIFVENGISAYSFLHDVCQILGERLAPPAVQVQTPQKKTSSRSKRAVRAVARLLPHPLVRAAVAAKQKLLGASAEKTNE